MNNNRVHEQSVDLLPTVRRARYQQLTIYEISDSELDTLEKGSPDSLFLNFAIFLLSVAISLAVAMVTTEAKSQLTFIIFLVLTIIGFLGGAFLLILWARDRSSVSKCAKTIRDRLPPAEGIQEMTKISPDIQGRT
jgi:hypothetical protein